MFAHMPLVVAGLLLMIGLAIALWKRNLIQMLMGLTVVEAAVNLFLVASGYRHDAIAPIYTNAAEGARMVLPTVQALTLTAIVIGLATTALMLSFVILIYRYYKTLDVNEVRKLRE
ncbi:MAG: cation:proton antiporter subunit C [Verrucomicrobiota bacterium]|nr:cation:proton antiporter subunit C [Verrucomicrobiota bacterium]